MDKFVVPIAAGEFIDERVADKHVVQCSADGIFKRIAGWESKRKIGRHELSHRFT